jgi:ABC-type transport system involved in multi-copper enzyme maturation permease subunit
MEQPEYGGEWMLSILHRELQCEARRPRTRWTRLVCTVIGFVACLALLFADSGGGGFGRRIFETLTFLAFWFSFIQGVRVAAGAIADEKREGTLAMLFLTPLTPMGIILGKFVSVAIPLIQPFLAFIPALAITPIVGGVTGTEILRAVAVVANALLFSIAVGLCVSSFSRQSDHTGRTTLLFLGVSVGLPLLVAYSGMSFVRLFSPWTAFRAIADEHYRMHPADFWLCTLALQYSAIGLLLAAAFFLPRRWEPAPVKSTWRFPSPKILMPKISLEQRAELLDRNPGEWLALRHGMNWVGQILFIGLIAVLTLAAGLLSTTGRPTSAAFVAVVASAVLLLVRLASQASYPFCDARRSGAVELLLSTPLDPMSLVTGQVVALKKQFLLPLQIVMAGAVLYSFRSATSGFEALFSFVMLAVFIAGMVVSIAALGMLMGVLEKSPAVAFFQTVLVGIAIAGPASLFSAPIPLVPLFLLGFAGNRLTSPDFPNLLKAISRRSPVMSH